MQKKITKGTGAFYDIELVVSTQEQEKAQEKVLKDFQKDLNLPGFRKGFVPMHLVKEHIKPEYMTVGAYEQVVNSGLHELLQEHQQLRFIGEPYDFHQEKKGEETLITLKLDVFPEVEVKGNVWKDYRIEAIAQEVDKKEVDESLLRLKKQYADYQDAEAVTLDSVSKVAMRFLDKKGEEEEKGTLYIGEQEFDEFPIFKKEFMGKTKTDIVSIAYKEKDLPPTLHAKKKDNNIATIECKLLDIKKVVLPAMDEETLKKLFGNESTVKTEAQLVKYIEDTLAQQKFDAGLMSAIENFLKDMRDKHMSVQIPHTLLEQEFGARLKSMEKRFGGAEQMKTYFEKMGEEKAKAFGDDIRNSAKESLEKFFILQKVAQDLELDVNWEQPTDLEIEKKLYAKLLKGGESVPVKKIAKKEEKEEKKEEGEKKVKKAKK